MNKVFLLGRLVANPEMRYTQNNTPVAGFRIAVDRKTKADNRENKVTDFFEITAWDKLGEFVCRWFAKGHRILVAGRIQNRQWTDKEGNTRYSTDIVAEELHFADARPADMGPNGYQYAPAPAQGYSGYQSQPPGYQNGPPGFQGPPSGYQNQPMPPHAAGGPARETDKAPPYNESSFSDLLDDDEELPF